MAQTTAFVPYQSKKPEPIFTNFYFHCGQAWDDPCCDSMHNDHCPVCNAEIEPYMSKENKSGDEIVHSAEVKAKAEEA